MAAFVVVTDGSCLTNGYVKEAPGGWAALTWEITSLAGDPSVLVGRHPRTSSTRMELTAVVRGLEGVPSGSDVLIVTDSLTIEQVLETVDQGEQDAGRIVFHRGKNAKGSRPADIDLWRLLITAASQHERVRALYLSRSDRVSKSDYGRRHDRAHVLAKKQARSFNRIRSAEQKLAKGTDWEIHDGKVVRRGSSKPFTVMGESWPDEVDR